MKVKELKQLLDEVEQDIEVYLSYDGLSVPLQFSEVNIEEFKGKQIVNIGE